MVSRNALAALGSAVMGLYANYPIGMAPGMGLNAYFAYAVVLGMGAPDRARARRRPPAGRTPRPSVAPT